MAPSILPRIVIHTDQDLTPPGKRRARIVPTMRGGSVLRWYVAGRIFRQLAPTPPNLALSRQWVNRA